MDLQWLQSDEAKKSSEEAKAKAWKDFKREYSFADLNKFEAQTDFNEKHATAAIYLKADPGFRQSVSESDRRYWSDDMKEALGIGGFPVELSLNYHPLFPVPAVQFEENPESFGELFNQKINIFVSPTEYFTTKFREIFSKTQIKHTTGKESRSWLSGPKMKYWPQQLNFALWCATTGSGISREIMHKLNQQLRAFYLFHVYFTVRRILFEMGGIQSFSALPGDPTFNQTENKYDSPSYKRICAEFGIDPNTDFRFVHGQNHGLGYCYVPGDPQPYKNWIYPPASLDNPSSQRFSDERGSATETGNKYLGNELDHITGSVAGYNNQLRQATPNMKLGVNNSVNLETKKVGVRLMDGGPSKIDRPTSHPSNPIHPNPIHKDQKTFQPPQAKLQKNKSEGNHEILKAGVFIGAAISAFIVYRMF